MHIGFLSVILAVKYHIICRYDCLFLINNSWYMHKTRPLFIEWHFTARSRKVSSPRDSGKYYSNRSDIWQTPEQQSYRDAYQASKRYEHYDIQSCGFEISRDLAARRPSASWIETLGLQSMCLQLSDEIKMKYIVCGRDNAAVAVVTKNIRSIFCMR